MRSFVLFFAVISIILVSGCEETQRVDTANDTGKQIMSLDYRDFDQAAADMVQSMLDSGALAKSGGGRYVVATGRIINDTMQRIDTNQLMAKVEQDLLNSGMVVMTSAVGSGTDELVDDMREVRDSVKGDEFRGDTLAGKGELIAPDMSLSGKIFQRNMRYDSSHQQVEYYFQLKLTDISSGLRLWQNETMIAKRGTNKTVPW